MSQSSGNQGGMGQMPAYGGMRPGGYGGMGGGYGGPQSIGMGYRRPPMNPQTALNQPQTQAPQFQGDPNSYQAMQWHLQNQAPRAGGGLAAGGDMARNGAPPGMGGGLGGYGPHNTMAYGGTMTSGGPGAGMFARGDQGWAPGGQQPWNMYNGGQPQQQNYDPNPNISGTQAVPWYENFGFGPMPSSTVTPGRYNGFVSSQAFDDQGNSRLPQQQGPNPFHQWMLGR